MIFNSVGGLTSKLDQDHLQPSCAHSLIWPYTLMMSALTIRFWPYIISWHNPFLQIGPVLAESVG